MVEIDWNSLFSSFFSMVRVMVACKDASKIPAKRLFEMKNCLYEIQFVVEGDLTTDEGGFDDNDNDDQGNGDDQGMEELEHDMSPENNGTHPGGKRSVTGGSGQGASGSGKSAGAGGKKQAGAGGLMVEDGANMRTPKAIGVWFP
jgi:hypothetical protein